jgi:very-short-patch-repair endonuclease
VPDPPPKTQLARKLRKSASLPERVLWSYLKDKQLGPKFRRQQPIGDYCVDFFCPELKLIIEVDGANHDFKLEYDNRRNTYFQSKGYKVVRLEAKSILKDLNTVLEFLVVVIEERRTELGS